MSIFNADDDVQWQLAMKRVAVEQSYYHLACTYSSSLISNCLVEQVSNNVLGVYLSQCLLTESTNAQVRSGERGSF